MEYNGEYPEGTGPGERGRMGRLVRSRRTQYISAAVVVVIIAVFISAPYIIKMQIESGLERAGMTGVEIADVDFNPVTGQLAVDDFAFSSPRGFSIDGTRVELRYSLLGLLRRRVELKSLKLDGVNVEVDAAVVAATGEKAPRPASERKGGGWSAGVALMTITESALTYRVPGGELTLDLAELTLAGYQGWDPDHTIELFVSAGLGGGTIVARAAGRPLSSEADLRAAIEAAGVRLSDFNPFLRGGASALRGELTADITVEASTPSAGGIMDITHGGTLAISGLSVDINDRRITADRAALHATVEAIHPPTGAGGRPVLKAFKGTFTAGGPGRSGDTVDDAGVSVASIPAGVELIGASSVDVSGISIDGDRRTTIEKVTLAGLRSGTPAGGGRKPALMGAALLSVEGMEVVPGELFRAASVSIDSPRLNIARSADGSMPMVKGVVSGLRGAKTADRDAAEPAHRSRIQIGSVEMTGKGTVTFDDGSVVPPFKSRLDLTEVRITGLDTAPTEAARGAKVAVKAGIGDYSTISIDGNVILTDTPVSMTLTGKATSLEMPPLSSYTAPLLGYNLTSGHMDADIKAGIDHGKIDGSVDVKLKGLEVAQSEKNDSEELTQELNMPLGAALSLLRDRDGGIRLNVPVEGDIKSPKFSLSGVINRALGKAMKKATFSYLKYAFQPYGTLITAVQVAGKLASSVRLDPVVYAPGAIVIAPETAGYLEKIAGFMNDRPGVTIKLCGHAVSDEPLDEWMAYRKAESKKKDAKELSEGPDGLALARAERVKAVLVESFGIADARMLVCLPEVDPAPVQPVGGPGAAATPATDRPVPDAEPGDSPAQTVPVPRVEILI